MFAFALSSTFLPGKRIKIILMLFSRGADGRVFSYHYRFVYPSITFCTVAFSLQIRRVRCKFSTIVEILIEGFELIDDDTLCSGKHIFMKDM